MLLTKPKKLLFFLLPSILLSSSLTTAQQSTDITIIAFVEPGSCEITLSTPTVDFGVMHISNLNNTTVNQLGSRTLNGTLDCDTAKVGMTIIDNRSSSANATLTPTITNAFADNSDATSGSHASSFFGLGTVSGSGAQIGNYVVALSSVDQGGTPLDKILSTDGGISWATDPQGRIAGTNHRISFASSGMATPVEVTGIVNFEMKITAAIQPINGLGLGSDDVVMDGNATITLVYF